MVNSTHKKDEHSLAEKIVEDLKKSGFASELECFEILSRKGWSSHPGAGYYDRDSNKTRNLDFVASWFELHRERDVWAEMIIPIEVKKSERPWVVLGREDILTEIMENPFIQHELPCELKEIRPVFQNMTIRKELNWIGHNVHESLKAPNEEGRWFEAASKLSKYTADFVKQQRFKSPNIEKTYDRKAYFAYLQPIVVLDGRLFQAISSPELSVKEIPYAPMYFDLGTPQYDQKSYRIDIVTLASLEMYLNLMEKVTVEVHNNIVENKVFLEMRGATS